MSDLAAIPGKGMHVHKLVKEVAEGLALATYEELAKHNDFYAQFPSPKEAVSSWWPLYIIQARATLAKMLAGPLDESLKDQISDALIRDNSLQRGRQHMIQMGEW